MERLLIVMVGIGAHGDMGHREFKTPGGELARQGLGAWLDAGPRGSWQDCCLPEARPCVTSALRG